MDRSLLISWYDVDANHRDEYLQWLHGSFLHKLMRRDSVLWAAHYEVRKYEIPSRVRPTRDPAVPRGNDFVLMLGAESSHVFAKPLDFFLNKDANCVEPDLTAEDRRMLALRKEVRTSIMTEEARVSGPSIAMRPDGGAPAPCIQLGSFCGNDMAAEEELLGWYARWRMPALSKLPGCVALRKMVSVAGWAHHGVMYEFESFDVRAAAMKEMAGLYPEMIEWTERCVPLLTHAHGSPHIGVRLWPAVV